MDELTFERDCWLSGDPGVPDPSENPQEESTEIIIGNLILKDPDNPEMGWKIEE